MENNILSMEFKPFEYEVEFGINIFPISVYFNKKLTLINTPVFRFATQDILTPGELMNMLSGTVGIRRVYGHFKY